MASHKLAVVQSGSLEKLAKDELPGALTASRSPVMARRKAPELSN